MAWQQRPLKDELRFQFRTRYFAREVSRPEVETYIMKNRLKKDH